jgi:integrase
MARVKKENERFQIKSVRNKKSTTFLVTGYKKDTTRIREKFKIKDDAIEYRVMLQKEEQAGEHDYNLERTTLSAEQLRDAESAVKLARDHSLSRLVSHYLTLEKRIDHKHGLSLDAAISFTESHYRHEIEELSIMMARKRFLDTQRGIEQSTHNHYTNMTKLLIKDDPNKPVHRFSVTEIQRLLSPYKNANTHMTYRRGLSIFFNWSVRMHHCLENPCLRLGKAPRVTTDIAILSLEETERLLKAATLLHNGVMVASVAILVFAGLRPSELQELEPKNIKSDRIRVTGGKLRRKLKRSVPMCPVLQEWLKAYPFKGRPDAWVYKMRKLKTATKATLWVSDILRHTSISFQLERDQDEGKVAFNNGTSSQMINQHYRDTIDDEEEVAAFWDLTPAKISTVELPEDIKQQDFKEWPTDAKLKKLVRAKPLSRLALDLNVSDSAIRKRCKQHDIELPKNGHWQREFQKAKSGR